eukprot:TRINITY_DN45044_c1_g1_i1.p1 TRINITY_DN45044_c1_g1~~TRINITY_DN45044_c1_g1_i1.p1  ORF type:complete len:108 (-),score=12.95 TRINITY_DN45044_c1_g1_i1:690-1013(-)
MNFVERRKMEDTRKKGFTTIVNATYMQIVSVEDKDKEKLQKTRGRTNQLQSQAYIQITNYLSQRPVQRMSISICQRVNNMHTHLPPRVLDIFGDPSYSIGSQQGNPQ